MPSRQDDEAAWESGSRSGGRSLLLSVGLSLAVAATAASFLTDDPRYLRLAVVVAAWGFVAAAFAATRRRGEQQAIAAREVELRRAYERELDLEVAARREYELELENDLRREVDDGVRAELAALREELGELAGLRAEVGRLRTELTEQLDGELLIERIIMRTQAFRKPADPATAPEPARPTSARDAGLRAADDGPAARALTGGRAELRWEEPRPTREYDTVRPVRASQGVTAETRASSFSWSPPPADDAPSPREWLADRALLDPAPTREPGPSRHAAAEPAPAGRPPLPPRDPATDDLAAPSRPVPHRRRRTDDETETGAWTDAAQTDAGIHTADGLAAQRPLGRPPVPDPEPRTEPGGAGFVRVSDLVAENGAAPPAGGRRRRRYRDEDEPDDVLARVLGQQ